MMPSTAGRVCPVVYNGMVTVLERTWENYTTRSLQRPASREINLHGKQKTPLSWA
jgi:hypothetical protein